MDEIKVEKKQEIEVDFQRLFGAIWKRVWLIATVAILAASLTFLGTFFFITPKYESSAMFYVNNSSFSIGDASLNVSTGDISASKELVESYIVILMTRTTLEEVIDYAEVDLDYEELAEMIEASSVNSTEIFEVVVTTEDPEMSQRIANAIAYMLPKRIATIIDGTSAEVVDAAIVPTEPCSPSYLMNTVIGFLLGMVMCVSVIVLREIFDITIRTEEDITQNCPHPILTAVPDMTSSTKGGYYYGYGSRGKETAPGKQPVLIGGDISFAASEAYKLLRTKLQFSFAGENDCRVIGVSSALSGEGKSLSTINLAYSLAQLDKKVLLIDCDMRRPSLATKLSIAKFPGLSNYLSGLCDFDELLQPCGIKGDEDAFSVVTAGRNPPNPIELLSSDKMNKLLKSLRDSYDYVILDLPPVGEVSDALAIAKQTDGMLLVVRQNYCNRLAVNTTVKQFAFVGAKVLGVIYNAAAEHNGTYGKKYYKKYGARYAGAYSRARSNTASMRASEGSDVTK